MNQDDANHCGDTAAATAVHTNGDDDREDHAAEKWQSGTKTMNRINRDWIEKYDECKRF